MPSVTKSTASVAAITILQLVQLGCSPILGNGEEAYALYAQSVDDSAERGLDQPEPKVPNDGMEEQCSKRDKAEEVCKKRYQNSDYIEACIHMSMADYAKDAGDSPYTFCGTVISWSNKDKLLPPNYETAKIPEVFPSSPAWGLEAVWGKAGVLCMERPRWQALAATRPIPTSIPKCFKEIPAPEMPCDDIDIEHGCQPPSRPPRQPTLTWNDYMNVDKSAVLFATYSIANDRLLSLNYQGNRGRIEPSGAEWPALNLRPPRNCDPEYHDCSAPAISIQMLATAGVLYTGIPRGCTVDANTGICLGESYQKDSSQFVPLYLWEKRYGSKVKNFIVSTAQTPDSSFETPGIYLEGPWVRASMLGYVHKYQPASPTAGGTDEQSSPSCDSKPEDDTACLARLVHRRTGQQFFSTTVPTCGDGNGRYYSLVRYEGRILKLPAQSTAGTPDMNKVLCNLAPMLKSLY